MENTQWKLQNGKYKMEKYKMEKYTMGNTKQKIQNGKYKMAVQYILELEAVFFILPAYSSSLDCTFS